MKKIFTFILNPTDEHSILSDICGAQNIDYSMNTNITSLRSAIEKIGMPDLILTDTESFSFLSDFKEVSSIEKKIILFKTDENIKGYDSLDISKLAIYLKDFNKDNKISDKEFIKFPINFFFDMDKAIVNIFIRIQKQGESKYILRYTKNDGIDINELKSYQSKGMKNLFVMECDKDELNNTLSNSLCYDMAANSSLDSMRNGLELARNLFQDSGYSPASIQLIEELNLGLYTKLEEESEKSSQGSIIKGILDSKDSLYFKKVALQAVLGMDILKKEDWSMERHFELFNFMSLFSDIALPKSEMIYVSTDDDFDEGDFSPKDTEILEKHAFLAFKLLENYQAKPINVDLLILEHHGVKSGIGFSKNIGANLNKIVVISRLSENIAIEMLKKERDNEKFSINDIVGIVDKKFDSPRVRSTLKNVI